MRHEVKPQHRRRLTRRLFCEQLESRLPFSIDVPIAADSPANQRAFEGESAAAESATGYLPVTEAGQFLRQQTVTGATIITHGFQLTPDGDSLMSLAQAIIARANSNNGPNDTVWFVDLDVVEIDGKFVGAVDASQSILGDPGTGELVLLFDWARESNESSAGWGAAAGDALFNVIVELGLASPTTHTAVPLHFIGHSFGTAVTSEAVERLATFQIPVDQVTYLDPHDFDQTGIPVDQDQRLFDLGRPDAYGATTWQNVAFTDVWYQTDGVLVIPNGRPIPGAYNVLLNDQVNSFNPHTEVWETFYRSTVDNASSTIGYAFSRIGGVTRPDLHDDTSKSFRFDSEPPSAQDHTYSPQNLTDEGNTVSQDDANFRKWEPNGNPLQPVNGDFEYSGSTFGSFVPGWNDHGGSGSGHVDCDNTCYLELDFGNSSRTHNTFYLPSSALALLFDLRRSDSSDNDQLVVRIGDQTLETISLSTEDATFARQLVTIPPTLRNKTATLEFAIQAGGFGVDSEVRIDNVRIGSWQNPAESTDVSGDQLVVPGDVLLVINEINVPKVRESDGKLPTTGTVAFGPSYYDVNGDQFVGPIDVLIVINHINSSPGEGEGSDGFQPTWPLAIVTTTFSENTAAVWKTHNNPSVPPLIFAADTRSEPGNLDSQDCIDTPTSCPELEYLSRHDSALGELIDVILKPVRFSGAGA